MSAFGLTPASGFPAPTEHFDEGVQYQDDLANVGPQKPKFLNFGANLTASYDAGSDTVSVEGTAAPGGTLSAGYFLTVDTIDQVGNTGFTKLAFLSDAIDVQNNPLQVQIDAGDAGNQVNVSVRNPGFRPRDCFLIATGGGTAPAPGGSFFSAQMPALNVSSPSNPTSDNPRDYLAYFVLLDVAEGIYSLNPTEDFLPYQGAWSAAIAAGDAGTPPGTLAGETSWWSIDTGTTPPTVSWYDYTHSAEGFAAIRLVQVAQSHLRAG